MIKTIEMAVIKIENGFSRIRIKINGLVHLSMKQSPDIQVQAWQNSKISYYAIEYYSSGESILCEYDSKEIWSEILIALEDNLII